MFIPGRPLSSHYLATGRRCCRSWRSYGVATVRTSHLHFRLVAPTYCNPIHPRHSFGRVICVLDGDSDTHPTLYRSEPRRHKSCGIETEANQSQNMSQAEATSIMLDAGNNALTLRVNSFFFLCQARHLHLD